MSDYIITISLNSMIIDSFELNKEEIAIGRDPFNDIVIDNPATSRYHATIYRENGRYIIEDLNSSNGTFVNNFVVTRKVLDVGDEILIGKHLLKVNPPKPNGAVLDLAFQSEGQYVSADQGTYMVDELSRRKIISQIQSSKYKNNPYVILWDNRKIYLKDSTFKIGKQRGNQIKVKGFLVKGVHAEITRLNPGTYKLISYGNFLSPVKVNGKTVKEHILADGDLVGVADLNFIFNE